MYKGDEKQSWMCYIPAGMYYTIPMFVTEYTFNSG